MSETVIIPLGRLSEPPRILFMRTLKVREQCRKHVTGKWRGYEVDGYIREGTVEREWAPKISNIPKYNLMYSDLRHIYCYAIEFNVPKDACAFKLYIDLDFDDYN
jgi:hypothetical protein